MRITILTREMEEKPISVSTAVLRDRSGRIVGGVEIFRDISEVEALRRALEGRRRLGDMVGASPPMT